MGSSVRVTFENGAFSPPIVIGKEVRFQYDERQSDGSLLRKLGGGPLRETHKDGTVSIELDEHSGEEAGTIVRTPLNARLTIFRQDAIDTDSRLKAIQALLTKHLPSATQVKLKVSVRPAVRVSLEIDNVHYSFDLGETDARKAYAALRAHIDSCRTFARREEDEDDARFEADDLSDDFCKGFARYEKEEKKEFHSKEFKSWKVLQGMMQEDGRIRPVEAFGNGLLDPEPIPEGYERKKVSRDWLTRFCPTRHSPATDVLESKTRYSTLTHDNGGNPFCVRVTGALVTCRSEWKQYGYMASDTSRKLKVAAYRVPHLKYIANRESVFKPERYYTDRIWDGQARKFFTGGNGSSVLVEVAPPTAVRALLAHVLDRDTAEHVQTFTHTYVFIGDCIYRFSTSEPIEAFFSPLGNSDVPYPVAVSATRTYYMLDRRHGARNTELQLSQYGRGDGDRNKGETVPMEYVVDLYGRIQ